MAYYVMSDTSELIERLESCPSEDDLRALADECGLDELWVIEGQHSGITWTRPAKRDRPRLVFGQPIPAELLNAPPEQKTFSIWNTW